MFEQGYTDHNKTVSNLLFTKNLSTLWERQIVETIDPNNKLRNMIIVGNIYRPSNNSLDNLNTFMAEFNSTLLEYHANGQNTLYV